MPWVKLDDGFFNNPTNRRLGPAGRDLFIASLTWCAQGLTDGRVDKDDLPVLLASAQAKPATVARLVDAGRWIDRGDHYEVDEYLTYQPSRERVIRDRAAAKERQQKSRDNRSHTVSHSAHHSVSHGVTDGVSHTPPDPTRPPSIDVLGGSPVTTGPTEGDGVDFEHRAPPRHDPAVASQLADNVRALRSALHPNPAEGA